MNCCCVKHHIILWVADMYMYYLGLTSSQYYFLRCHSAIDSLNIYIFEFFFLSFISRIFLHFYFYFNALFLQWSDYHNYHCFLHTLMNQKWHTYLVEISTYVMNDWNFFGIHESWRVIPRIWGLCESHFSFAWLMGTTVGVVVVPSLLYVHCTGC